MAECDGFLCIDFGTSNSKAAWISPRTDQAEVLSSLEGHDRTPSLAYYGDQETLLGQPAANQLANITQLCDEGRRRAELGRFVRGVKRVLRPGYTIALSDGRSRTAVAVAADILGKLKADVEQGYFHGPVTRAVLTYPAAFGPTQKQALAQAAQAAGFADGITLMEEPVAAAMAFAHEARRAPEGVLVYDFGGGTFDLALVVRQPDGGYELALPPDGDAECGGQDIDQLLYDYLDAQVRKCLDRPVAPDGVDLAFLAQCQKWKEMLSSQASIQSQALLPGRSTPVPLCVDRPTLEALIDQLIARTVSKTAAMVQRSRDRKLPLDALVLIGGSSQIPLIRERLHKATELEPRWFGRKDVAVALGAAHWTRRGRCPKPDQPYIDLLGQIEKAIHEQEKAIHEQEKAIREQRDELLEQIEKAICEQREYIAPSTAERRSPSPP